MAVPVRFSQVKTFSLPNIKMLTFSCQEKKNTRDAQLSLVVTLGGFSGLKKKAKSLLSFVMFSKEITDADSGSNLFGRFSSKEKFLNFRIFTWIRIYLTSKWVLKGEKLNIQI